MKQKVPVTLALLLAGASADESGPQRYCGSTFYPALDAQYEGDHANYLCKNWTRPWRLPCRPARELWTPNWPADEVMILAWGEPTGFSQNEIDAYLAAGFSMMSGGPGVNLFCAAQRDANRTLDAKDEILDAWLDFAETKVVGEYGLRLQVTNLGNGGVGGSSNCTLPNTTEGLAFGGRAGGIFIGATAATPEASGHLWPAEADGVAPDPRKHAMSDAEFEYVYERLEARGLTAKASVAMLRDDTTVQIMPTLSTVGALRARWPNLPPLVNQQMGNSGPADLYHGDIFIAAPEQYKMDGCAGANGTRAQVNGCVSSILAEFTDNAAYDERFGLEHWPLFFAHAGLGDSGNRMQAYAALASGARGLIWYVWDQFFNRTADAVTPVFGVLAEVPPTSPRPRSPAR